MKDLLNKIHLMGCMDLMAKLPDKSIALIIADPPYFEVKGKFDFIWKSFEDYLKDVEKWAKEFKRVLADNGSLLYYGHAKKIAYSQIVLDKYFNLENCLVWEKIECQTRRGIENFNSFAPVTERILFYSNEIEMTGLEFIEKEFVAPRNPFAKLLKKARIERNVSINQIAEYGNFYGNVNHGGSVTNWEKGYNIPSSEQWTILCEFLQIKINYEDLRINYEDLRKEYEDLRKEYEDLRRPFNNYLKLSDCMKFSQESNVSNKFDHDTIKPRKLTTALIRTCSKENDIVLIPFSGSGTEVEMCIDNNRQYIACELDPDYHAASLKRIQPYLDQGKLF